MKLKEQNEFILHRHLLAKVMPKISLTTTAILIIYIYLYITVVSKGSNCIFFHIFIQVDVMMLQKNIF